MSTAVEPARKTAGQRNPPWRANVSPTGAHFWHRKRREVSRLLARHVSLPADAQIVDLGAGSGGDVLLLASLFPDAKILALDADREAVDALDKRFAELPNVTTLCADLRQRLPIEEETVDLGHCSEVLEHIPDPKVVLAEARRVIKPGGYLLITTPNEPNVLQKSFWLRRKTKPSVKDDLAKSPAGLRQGAELYGHISLGTVKEWERTLSDAGFQRVGVGRGALMYGARRWLDREAVLAAYFAAEALLDLAPRRLTRRLSNDLVGLYRRT